MVFSCWKSDKQRQISICIFYGKMTSARNGSEIQIPSERVEGIADDEGYEWQQILPRDCTLDDLLRNEKYTVGPREKSVHPKQ